MDQATEVLPFSDPAMAPAGLPPQPHTMSRPYLCKHSERR